MTLQDWGLLATIIVAVATAAFTGIKTWADRRAGVRSTEHTERRDTVADRDALIDQLQEQLTAAIDRAEAAEVKRRDAVELLEKEREYTQVLRDHIYRRREPPPPQRNT